MEDGGGGVVQDSMLRNRWKSCPRDAVLVLICDSLILTMGQDEELCTIMSMSVHKPIAFPREYMTVKVQPQNSKQEWKYSAKKLSLH